MPASSGRRHLAAEEMTGNAAPQRPIRPEDQQPIGYVEVAGGDVDSDQDGDEENEHGGGAGIGYAGTIPDFRQLMLSIEKEDEQDLRLPLAIRAHAERTVERRWQSLYERQSGVQTDADYQDEERMDQRLIAHHLSCGVPSTLLRWPLPVSSVPTPQWSLADEVCAILQHDRRRRDAGGSEREDEGVDDDEPPSSIVAPAIARCQAGLCTTLHDLAHRVVPSGGQSRIQKQDIVTWRDVLKTLEMRDEVPIEVLAATESRLRSIYGSAEMVPAAAALCSFGVAQGIASRLQASLHGDHIVELSRSERHERMTEKRKRRRDTLQSDPDADLLIPSPFNRSYRMLAKGPTPRSASKANRQQLSG